MIERRPQDGAVNYGDLDPFKIAAQLAASATAGNLANFGYEEVSASRGESAYVWDEGDKYGAATPEGLGTKNLVADQVRELTGKSHYDAVAQDTVAMIVNDLITVGALPKVIMSHWSVAESSWLNDHERAADLIRGWANACNLAGAAWGSGETPALKDILLPGAIELSGAAVGDISPKDRHMNGENLRSGDAIIFLAGNGIHSNGLTNARQVAAQLEHGYATVLSNGQTFGEALLRPTPIYVDSLKALFNARLNPIYAVNMTGHGWRKLMRARQDLTYVVDKMPVPQPEFDLIQAVSGTSDEKMYGTFNMGAGFAYFTAPEHADLSVDVINAAGYRAFRAGYIESGPKQVVIKHKGITFDSPSLGIR